MQADVLLSPPMRRRRTPLAGGVCVGTSPDLASVRRSKSAARGQQEPVVRAAVGSGPRAADPLPRSPSSAVDAVSSPRRLRSLRRPGSATLPDAPCTSPVAFAGAAATYAVWRVATPGRPLPPVRSLNPTYFVAALRARHVQGPCGAYPGCHPTAHVLTFQLTHRCGAVR